jgi:3-dehydroquinate synthase II
MKDIWVDSPVLAKKHKVRFLGEKGRWTEAAIRTSRDVSKLRYARLSGADRAFISCPDWVGIPKDELSAISKKLKLVAKVKSASEAKEALCHANFLAGFFLSPPKSKEIEKLKRFIAGEGLISLRFAKISNIRKAGIGERSVIDTCEILSPDEGMLVGSEPGGFFLVQAEAFSEEGKPGARPFRINAGAVSLYALLQEEETIPLADVQAGSDCLVVDKKGRARNALVGSNLIEHRPLILVEAELGKKKISALFQESESVFLVGPKEGKSVLKLKKGDSVLVHMKEK